MTYALGNNEACFAAAVERLKSQSFEIGPIRPPNEGVNFSLLIRATRNCPWNRCAFCLSRPFYREPFTLRPIEEIKADIDAAKTISQEIIALSHNLGYAGEMEPLAPLIRSVPLYGREIKNLTDTEMRNFQSIFNIFYWLYAGGKTAFLQDADTLIMPAQQLIAVVSYLKATFASLKQITSYARAKTLVKKRADELSQLRQAGLSRLHVGLESGDNELLSEVNKGVTAEEQIAAGEKALAAGFELSEYVMPGLGGEKRWLEHARKTASVLNEINPHFIRLRPFVPAPGTPLMEAYQKGEFKLLTPHEQLREIRLLLENLKVASRVCFDHNYNPTYRSGNSLVPLLKRDSDGYKFPEEKELVLELIDRGLQLDESAFVTADDWIRHFPSPTGGTGQQ